MVFADNDEGEDAAQIILDDFASDDDNPNVPESGMFLLVNFIVSTPHFCVRTIGFKWYQPAR